MIFFTGLTLALTLVPNTALAYLDPGTGSIILQALAAGVISISVAFTSFRIKVSQFISSLFKRSGNKSKKTGDEKKLNKAGR